MKQEWETLEKFSKVMPEIRLVTLQEDGELTGCWSLNMQDVGWNVPAVGDRLFKTHDVGDYESRVVTHRLWVDEGFGPNYWLLVLKHEDESPLLTSIANHTMLVTDLDRASAAGDPDENVIARMQQLLGQPSGRMRIQPKSRNPEPDRGWDDEDGDTP